jgi:uncharacterized repeat protein (TIGR04076 family)
MKAQTLQIEVASVQGRCPVHDSGDLFWIKEGFQLVTDRPLCMHALLPLSPYYVALSRGIAPKDLGLAGDDEAIYVQCLDPERYTGGGTVVLGASVVACEGSQ